MKAEIITIGDEILIGQIADTNSQWIATQLTNIGVKVDRMTSIQDHDQQIVKALDEAFARVDLVIFTGGLGPTKDDLTKLTLTRYFNDRLVRYTEVEEHIKKLFSLIKYPFTDKDLEQADLPENAAIMINQRGTASGMWFSNSSRHCISLPGVPNEMKGLMKKSVLPELQNRFELPFILHRTIHTYGMGESRVARKLADWEDKLPEDVKLAYLPSYGRVRLRLSTEGWDKEVLESKLTELSNELTSLLGDIVVDKEGGQIEYMVHQLAEKHKLTISCAESCTGGAIAAKFTGIPGISSIFKGGVVAYHPDVKVDVLGVSRGTINDFSVVSKEVAQEMVVGVAGKLNTDYAISTTGNAGPTKDKTDRSIGVVFIAVRSPNGVICREFNFGQPREKVIEKAASKAMEMLHEEILKNTVNSLRD